MRSITAAFGAVCALALSALPAKADTLNREELVFFVQYIGSDYGVAVQDGKVVDDAEYREMLDLSGRVLEGYGELRPHGSARSDLTRLRDLIRSRAPWEAVRSVSRELVPRIVDELDVVPCPAEAPDLERGRALYREDCAPCHGVTGGGDGPASSGMTPRPTSFREQRMALLSPHQAFNATRFGIPGTGMPSFGEAITPRDTWDLAFFLMTMRDGFDPSPPVEVIPLSLKELAERSDEELLVRLRVSRPGARTSEIDFQRAQFRPPKPPDTVESAVVGDSSLEAAESIERAFGRAADKVFPSVVGVSVYEKSDKNAAARATPAPGSTTGAWMGGDPEDQLYPGFRRRKAGSGFLVGDDGYILTRAGLLSRDDPAKNSDVVDVELTGNVHCRARVVGIEPTIDLAVLRIIAPVPVRSATIGDSDNVRVGQWAIAVGDPPGPERIFGAGTISARPERECYQEHRTSTLLQSSSAIESAGFGGPLVNIRGEVVGLTIPGPDTRVAPSGDGIRGVNALPINLAMTIYRALKVKESERSPWIGISVLDLSSRLRGSLKSPPLTGIYIEDVFAPSPASRIGIRAGDVLTKMDDHRMLGVSDFQTWLYLLGIDSPVTLEISRDGEIVRKVVTIEQRPESAVAR